MADRNDSFAREVDEEIRHEQLLKLWEKYGLLIVGAVVALLAGIGIYKWTEARRIASEEANGARFETAMRLAADGKSADAAKAFSEVALNAPPGYRTLARLRIAGERATTGKVADALAEYEAVSKESGAGDLVRDFAALQAAVLRLDQADWTEMKNRLTPLAEPARPWHALAREMLGVAAFKAGRTDEAMKSFELLLGDRATTEGINRRSQEMLAILTDAAAAKSSSDKSSSKADGASKAPAAAAEKGPGAPAKK